jgi:uncharacterized FAD-dependent dehydrogenase
MKTLVHFGAPNNILVDGKPHLGTDRLIPLLRNFRQHLQGLGVSNVANFFLTDTNGCMNILGSFGITITYFIFYYKNVFFSRSQ